MSESERIQLPTLQSDTTALRAVCPDQRPFELDLGSSRQHGHAVLNAPMSCEHRKLPPFTSEGLSRRRTSQKQTQALPFQIIYSDGKIALGFQVESHPNDVSKTVNRASGETRSLAASNTQEPSQALVIAIPNAVSPKLTLVMERLTTALIIIQWVILIAVYVGNGSISVSIGSISPIAVFLYAQFVLVFGLCAVFSRSAFLYTCFVSLLGISFIICVIQIEGTNAMFLSLVNLSLIHSSMQVRSSLDAVWRCPRVA